MGTENIEKKEEAADVVMSADDFKNMGVMMSEGLKEGITALVPDITKAVTDEINKEDEEGEKKRPALTTEVNAPELSKDPKGGFSSFGDFSLEVAKSARGDSTDARIEDWKVASKSLSTVVSDALGVFVPPEFSLLLIGNIIAEDPLIPLMTQVGMATGNIKLPYIDGYDKSGGLVYGGIKVYWASEGATGTESEPQAEQFDATLHEIIGLVKVNQTLLDDSPVSIEGILQAGFRDGFTYKLNNAFIRGTGTGQPLGILNSPALITVAKETDQTATTFVYENSLEMMTRLHVGGDGSSIRWLINRDVYPQLAKLKLDVGLGGSPVWQPSGDASATPYTTLLGYPIVFFDHCSTLGAVGDVMLVNLKQQWVFTKRGMTDPAFASSIHLDFDKTKVAYRWNYRVDARSPWPTAFKPPQSTKTRSPFVALAART